MLMALVLLDILLAISSGDMLRVFSSMSAKTGLAPQKSGAFAVAAKVMTGVITSSPGPMLRTLIDRCSAAVQLFTETAYFAPTYSAKVFSNSAAFGPPVSQRDP